MGNTISKRALIRLLVIFIITAIVCWMWNIKSSRTLTHCISTEASRSTADTTKSSTLSCGVPCAVHDTEPGYQELFRILNSYQTSHKSEREKAIAGQPVNSLTWYCITGCGGIGDRMKGMYAAFLLALAMNRTFFIYQSEEVQKTMYIEPNAIDWRPVNGCVKMYPDETLDLFGHPSHWQHTLFGESNNFSLVIDGMEHKQHIYVSWIRSMRTLIRNINQSYIAQENQPLVTVLLSLFQKKIIHCLQSILHQYLFQVPQQVVREAASALAMLNMHPQNFVSVHIRTGFMNSWLGEITIGWDFLKGTRFARTQASWRGMIDCALRIADSVLGNHSLLLVSSDDQEPKDWAVATYGARIRILNFHPLHVGKQLRGSREHNYAYLQNWVELAVMAQSRAIVRIPSGFSDTASHMCSMSPATVYTYNIADKWCRDISNIHV